MLSDFFENVNWAQPITRHILNHNNGAMWSFLKNSESVDRIIVGRHPMIRFWSAWNQKFLKNQKIGDYICQFTSLAPLCDENKLNQTLTHLVDFQTFATAFINENCRKNFGDCNALNVWNEHFARQGL